MDTLNIKTHSKTYPLYIGSGILPELSAILRNLNLSITKILIISDDQVAPLYMDSVTTQIKSEYPIIEFIIPSGEASKNIDWFYECQTCALSNGLDRSSLIIALGGGVVGDLAGFVAATFQRGIPFIQIPTTLLAHDSAVGGKVAINHPLGKNMIGAFHQPEAVIFNIDFIETLPKKELLSGFAEVIKEAIIWDKSFYNWLRNNITTLSDLKDEKLQYAIEQGISIKSQIVAMDEKENDIRAILNFGHTLGHAIEAELGYGEITHGEAVLIGMLFAIKVSEETYPRHLYYEEFKQWFSNFGYCTDLPAALDKSRLVQRMKKDKKANAGTIRMVLLKEIGKVEVQEVRDDLLYKLLN
ncbi:3-dehydroquinate synthase [Bacillus luteolus]|uniref:3-dehydroquinate synthase n=1 Tax=Litchfieldia luteola TaxID=682179 RepID=A0ABR9QPA9_9BACI|nr:3-dehydroquinate synthase [Cytobacillus luteolus]MBE4910284.1 3-dehydroquinate synthase [Cytobacillus luteolus]MBP1942143.1 3-dehydroquinate synthase [Cytobacillus luteolus]